MKALLTMSIVILATIAQAKTTKNDLNEKVKFNNLTALEAFASNHYEKSVWNIQMPGTSTWLNPAYEMCITGNSVTSTRPITKCTQWSASDDGTTKTFNSMSDADAYGNNVQCSKSESKILSSPISYSVMECVLWGVQSENFGIKTFKYLGFAKQFADSNQAAHGAKAQCMQKAVVSKKVPTTYKVDFTLNDEKMGTHVYSIRNCSGQEL